MPQKNAPPENNGSGQPPQPESGEVPTATPENQSPKNKGANGKRKKRQKKDKKDKKDENEEERINDIRGWIMIVAVQVAAATYAGGLNPPGGFWPDDHDNHTAGNAILHDKSKHRYTTFYYANATAFMASLAVIVLLMMNEKFYKRGRKLLALNFNMVLCLVSLMIAYAVGSARRITTSLYAIILAIGVLLFIFFSSHILSKSSKKQEDSSKKQEDIKLAQDPNNIC